MTRESAKQLALKHCKPFTRVGDFGSWVFPVINNVAVEDLAHIWDDIVDAQPMQQPSDGFFYLDIIYGSKWSRFKAWCKWNLWFRWRHYLRWKVTQDGYSERVWYTPIDR